MLYRYMVCMYVYTYMACIQHMHEIYVFTNMAYIQGVDLLYIWQGESKGALGIY